MRRDRYAPYLPTLLLGGVVLLAAASDAPAQGRRYGPMPPPARGPMVHGFEPMGRYQLWVDGEPYPEGKVAMAQRSGSMVLLRGDAFDGPVLLEPRNQSIERLPEGAVSEAMDGTLSVQRGSPPRKVGRYELGEEGLVIPLDAHRIELRGAPWKLGPTAGEALLASNDGYAFRSERYRPRPEAMGALEGTQGQVQVLTFFGSWCGACSQRIPRILRVQEELATEAIHFDYYGLPSPFRGEPEAESYDIQGVPTSVVLRDGEEIGRIRGKPWEAPEVALREILQKAGMLGD